jgi:hypothetical protein
VLFLRNNMAALAWAVERTLNGSLDLPVDGYEYLARLRLDLLAQPAQPSAAGPDISYTLEYPVPDSWIPMIPVLTALDLRQPGRQNRLPTMRGFH